MLKIVREVPNSTKVDDWDPHLYGGRTREQVEANLQEAVLLVRIVIRVAIIGGVVWLLWKFSNLLISFGSGF